MASATSLLSIDIAFVLDCTDSVRQCIANAIKNILLIVDAMAFDKTVSARFVLIKYRDHPIEDNTFVTDVSNFTSSVVRITQCLAECNARGGGDGPEAVADALNDAFNLPWRSEADKICILIADAPPHGVERKVSSRSDEYPYCYDPLEIVKRMDKENIKLHTVGVEPIIEPYRYYFTTLAKKTGGEYFPAENADGWADNMINKLFEQDSSQPADVAGSHLTLQSHLLFSNENNFNPP